MMIATMRAVESGFQEEDLVRSACLGDRKAFGELYRRYARIVHGLLLARVPADDAEDLVQDVFVSAMKKLPLLRAPGAFRGWLMSIARNRAIDFHRTSRDRTELPQESAHDAVQASRQEAHMVLDVIRALPEAYRETLILRLAEGMTGPEIAARTGLTPDSVRVNLSRGFKMLREQLGGTAK